MRCITSEERNLLMDAVRRPSDIEDGGLEDMSDREEIILESLVRRGNARTEVMDCGDGLACTVMTITPRGKLAIACFDATNARVFA